MLSVMLYSRWVVLLRKTLVSTIMSQVLQRLFWQRVTCTVEHAVAFSSANISTVLSSVDVSLSVHTKLALISESLSVCARLNTSCGVTSLKQSVIDSWLSTNTDHRLFSKPWILLLNWHLYVIISGRNGPFLVNFRNWLRFSSFDLYLRHLDD